MRSAYLRLVRSSVNEDQHALAIKAGTFTQVKIREADVPVPLISLRLTRFYQLGNVINAGIYGPQIAAEITLSYKGKTLSILGAAMTLLDGDDLVLPFGILSRQNTVDVMPQQLNERPRVLASC